MPVFECISINQLIDCLVFYAVSAIFQPCKPIEVFIQLLFIYHYSNVLQFKEAYIDERIL